VWTFLARSGWTPGRCHYLTTVTRCARRCAANLTHASNFLRASVFYKSRHINTTTNVMNVTGGASAPTVTASSVAGSATLVYQLDRTGPVVTVSPQDLTTAAGLNNVASHLQPGAAVKVFGVPQADGSIKAYAIFYYTGAPTTR